jgi:hypothetical protein
VKRSRYPLFSRAGHIADAPIELLQGVFRCLSIALHLGFGLTDSSPPQCVLSTLMRVVSTVSASATGHHNLLHEDDVVDFLTVVPRLDDAEPDVDFFAAGRGRPGDDPLNVDFFAAERGWLDVVAVGAGFFAGLLAGGSDADRPSEP